MALAIKRVHNLPMDNGRGLSYVSAPPDIRSTQKLKCDIDELQTIDTWDRITWGIIDEAIDQWQTRSRACVKAKKGRNFEHLP